VKVLGADLLAEPAKTARVDELVRLAVPHYNGKVVVNLAYVLLGVGAKTVEIFTDLDALEALTLHTSFGFQDGLIGSVAQAGMFHLYSWKWFYTFSSGVETGFIRSFVETSGGQGDLLQEPVDGDCRNPAV